MGADLDAGVHGAAVQPHPCPARRPVGSDRASVRPEPVRRVLGGDPALQRSAVDPDLLLEQTKIIKRLPRGNPHLGLHQIDVGDLLGDRVLDLDPRIHLDEDVLAGPWSFGLDQKLHGASARIVDRLGEANGVATERLPQLIGDVGRGRDLDDFLVPPLHRAVPLEEMQGIAVLIGEDLHLDVPRPAHGLLNEGGRVAEGALRLPHGRADGLSQLAWIVDPAHATAPASCDRLDEDREANVLRTGQQLLQVSRGRGRLEGGQSGGPGRVDRPHFVAGQLQHIGGRPDEGDPGFHTRPSQLWILAEESVTGIDRIGAGLSCRLDHRLYVEVGPDGMAALADLVGLVGLDAVHRVAILVREHGDGLHAELVRGAKGADRNLTSVGDQNLGEHALRLSTVCYCPDTGWRSGVVMANRTVT